MTSTSKSSQKKAVPTCSEFDLGRLAEMDRKRLEAEAAWDDANRKQQEWTNEAARRWKVAVELGEEWHKFKQELGLANGLGKKP